MIKTPRGLQKCREFTCKCSNMGELPFSAPFQEPECPMDISPRPKREVCLQLSIHRNPSKKSNSPKQCPNQDSSCIMTTDSKRQSKAMQSYWARNNWQ